MIKRMVIFLINDIAENFKIMLTLVIIAKEGFSWFRTISKFTINTLKIEEIRKFKLSRKKLNWNSPTLDYI